MDTFSMLVHHVTQQKPSQTGFMNITVSMVFLDGLLSDLNAIEHLWDEVQREIRGMKNLQEFV